MDDNKITNIVLAGIGGQGVIKASDILAEAAFAAGLDVKKSEIHGMSQRGGSVTSDVRFGRQVFSPMVPPGEADFLVVLEPTQIENNRAALRPGGILLTPELIDPKQLPNIRSLNIALLGALSRCLDIPEQTWIDILHRNLPQKFHEANDRAFRLGRGVRPRTRCVQTPSAVEEHHQ
jgi:indolepyruvate ferredoxin oxidoreductase beta subunit